MYMFPWLLFLVLIMTRSNSTYHPHLLFKRYVIIKNKAVSKLLIGQSNPIRSYARNAKANRNKLTYAGIVFYLLALLLICFWVIMALLPDFPCESFVFEPFEGDTLNEKLSITLGFALFFAEYAFLFINTSKYAVEGAAAKRITGILFCFFSVMFSAGMVFNLWRFVESILGYVINRAP